MAPKINMKDRIIDDEMDLGMSDLKEVPVKEIAKFPKLKCLDLSNNHLQLLTPQFCQLTNLVELDLSKNQLEVLPLDFGKLCKLRSLDLYSNKLVYLPLSFGDLKNLRFLDLKDNPLVEPLARVVGPCLDIDQCTRSAKNTVLFYSHLQVRYREDDEKREADRQKSLENNKKTKQQQQQKNKSKKGQKQSTSEPSASKGITPPPTEATPIDAEERKLEEELQNIEESFIKRKVLQPIAAILNPILGFMFFYGDIIHEFLELLLAVDKKLSDGFKWLLLWIVFLLWFITKLLMCSFFGYCLLRFYVPHFAEYQKRFLYAGLDTNLTFLYKTARDFTEFTYFHVRQLALRNGYKDYFPNLY